MALRNQRPHIRILHRISNGDGICFLCKTFHKFILDTFLDDNPGTCGAHLALIQENTDHGPFHCAVQIRICKDHIGWLSAKLKADLFYITCCRTHDTLSNFRTSGKSNHIHIFALRDPVSCNSARAKDQVHAALGHSDLLKNPKQFHTGKHTVGTWFKHHTVTGCQCRSQFPHTHQQRIVPGSDQSAHANRLMNCIGMHFSKTFIYFINAALWHF